MAYYIGLDVSQKQTSLCVVDAKGLIVAEGKALTEPEALAGWLLAKKIDFSRIVKVGLEAGAMSNWLCTELAKRGLPILCIEAWQAHQFLKTQLNKTDKNDARGLAQMVRMGETFIKTVSIRSQDGQALRTLLTLRQQLVQQKLGLENNITGVFKPFGIVTLRGNACATTFRERVSTTVQKAEDRGIHVGNYALPSLAVYDSLCKELARLTKQVEAAAKNDPVCRRLMTAPGVGPVVALSFMTAIDDPKRFCGSEDIGAYLGLTPRQYQSGETDIRGPSSRRGNAMTRQHLVQAATVLLTGKKWSPLKAWGMKLARKRGFFKARIAVARKLSIVLHRMWINEKDFRWTSLETDKKLAGTTPA
jgi:transposase